MKPMSKALGLVGLVGVMWLGLPTEAKSCDFLRRLFCRRRAEIVYPPPAPAYYRGCAPATYESYYYESCAPTYESYYPAYETDYYAPCAHGGVESAPLAPPEEGEPLDSQPRTFAPPPIEGPQQSESLKAPAEEATPMPPEQPGPATEPDDTSTPPAPTDEPLPPSATPQGGRLPTGDQIDSELRPTTRLPAQKARVAMVSPGSDSPRRVVVEDPNWVPIPTPTRLAQRAAQK